MRVALALLALMSAPAAAEVVRATPEGFEISQTLAVDAPLAQTWAALGQPQRWWDKEHSYSGDSANLALGQVAGGCFCERLGDGGTIEHARIVYIQPPRMIRMVGSLGPLQAEAVTGTLTFRVEADPEKRQASRVTLSYVVGGYMRGGGEAMAPKVDEVLAIQLLNLKSASENPVRRSKPDEGR